MQMKKTCIIKKHLMLKMYYKNRLDDVEKNIYYKKHCT